MKKIRLRLWDRNQKIFGIISDIDAFLSFLKVQGDFEIDLYTGMDDSEGNQIFENDVIETKTRGEGTVIFKDYAFQLRFKDGTHHSLFLCLFNSKDIKKIGNEREMLE